MVIFSKKNLLVIVLLAVTALAIVVGFKLSQPHVLEKTPLIPLNDFFKNPEKTSYQLSPDGNYLSFLAPYQHRMNIFVQKIGENGIQRITSVTERDISKYFWKNNDLLMYLMDNKGDENFHLFGVNKDSSEIKDFTPFNDVRVEVVDKLEDNEDYILVGTNKRDKKVSDVYRLNIQTGSLDLIAQNPGNVLEWLTDHEGKLRVALMFDGANKSILYRTTEAEPFKTILTTNFRNDIEPAFFTFDNKQLYIASNINRDKKAIAIFDPSKKEETQLIYEHPDYDIQSEHVYFSRKRKILTQIEYDSWKLERINLDTQTEAMFKRLEQELKDGEIRQVAHNKNEDKFIIKTSSDRNPGSYYLYDLATDSLIKLTDSTPWLKKEHLASVKPISYTARDGITINGYLTLPLGKQHKNLPIIAMVHGGPWDRDVWRYNPELQFLANRGYGVLQMNFRGSQGYGKKFRELSFKQWGKSMQDDITDGVKWLIDQGIADPKRIAIYGYSYGGYAVLAGLAFTPDLYACGIDYCGPANIFTFYKSFPEFLKPMLEMLYEMVGHPEQDKELLTHISPVFHANKIKAPLFIAQGRMDARVNVDESDQMVEALKKRGVEVVYMVKDNEGHMFDNEENKFDFYEAMEKFLAQYLRP